MEERSSSSSSMLVGATLLGIALAFAAAVALVTNNGLGRRSVEPTALLRQSVTRLTQTQLPTLSYDVVLDVATDDDQLSTFSVHGQIDEPSTVSTGTVQLLGFGGPTVLRFMSSGHRLFLLEDRTDSPAQWTEVDFLAALQPGDGHDLDLLALALQRPTALAAVLRGAVAAEEVGEERLATGVNTKRYRARVSFDRALRVARATVDPDLLAVLTQRIDGDEIELDAWVDSNRRLRALSLSGTLDGGRRYTLTLTVRGLSVAVPTRLPTATTVVEVADLERLLAGSSAT